MLEFVFAVLALALLLRVGEFFRRHVLLLRVLLIPSSVVAGFVGLLLLMILLPRVPILSGVHAYWKSWPSLLIAVVFAALLLESPGRSFLGSARNAWREGLVVWIIVLGQTTIGLCATLLVLKPAFGVKNSFGMLIETGFAGGHGTAKAMGEVFALPHVALAHGEDLGLMMATVGLVASVTTGILYINIASRLGWVDAKGSLSQATNQSKHAEDSPLVSWKDYFGQAMLLAVAFWIGWGMREGIVAGLEWLSAVFPPRENDLAANASPQSTKSLASIVADFPLFIYTMFGGLILRRILGIVGAGGWVRPIPLRRLVGWTMDVLVVAAIATLNVLAVRQSAAPLLILAGCGLLWCAFCLFVVGRWLLPKEHWFQLGLINYGMSTGTTATGFVLLRVVDPQLRTKAAEDYALAAPISAPFVGGGMLTLGLPMFVLERQASLGFVCWALAGCMLILVVIASKLRE